MLQSVAVWYTLSRSECVAVCCSVLQCVAVCCRVLQCGTLYRDLSVLQRVAVCCSVLQCVAECCSVVHSIAIWVCCSVLQCVAECCRVLQCGTLYCDLTFENIYPVLSALRCVRVRGALHLLEIQNFSKIQHYNNLTQEL